MNTNEKIAKLQKKLDKMLSALHRCEKCGEVYTAAEVLEHDMDIDECVKYSFCPDCW